jgi:hypothetical protein
MKQFDRRDEMREELNPSANNRSPKSRGGKSKRSKKGKRNGNSYNNNGKVNTKFSGSSIDRKEDTRPDVRRSTENDPAWYGVSGQMVADTARLSFNHPAGLPHHIIPSSTDLSFIDDRLYPHFDERSVPGIFQMEIAYGPGTSANETSAVNLAAKNIYTFVRHVNSGASNYDSPDLMLYLLALDSAYALYAELVRVYGILRTYRQSNMYLPRVLTASLGYNHRSLISSLPRLRYIINTFVRKIGSRPVPGNLNIMKRHTWMFSNLFTDATSNKAQFYHFVPYGHYYYEETEGAGKLVFNSRGALVAKAWDEVGPTSRPTSDYYWDIDDIEYLCEFIANRILASEDLGIISGDVLKAYGSNIFMLSEIGDDLTIEAIHSPEVLSQIHNSRAVGDLVNMDITQDASIGSGALLWEPLCADQYRGIRTDDQSTDPRIVWSDINLPLDLWSDNPTPDEVMVATRLTARYDSRRKSWINDTTWRAYVVGGTEFPARYRVWSINKTETGYGYWNITSDQWRHISTNMLSGVHSIKKLLEDVDHISVFDWHPHLRWWACENGEDANTIGNKWQNLNNFGDIDNVIYVESSTLERMDRTAVLSEWDVPEAAFYKG